MKLARSRELYEKATYLDLIVIGLPGSFDALKVNAVLGSSRFSPRSFGS